MHQLTTAGRPRVNAPVSRPTPSLTHNLGIIATLVFVIGSIYGGVQWMSSGATPSDGMVLQTTSMSLPKGIDAMGALRGTDPPAAPATEINIETRFVLAGVVDDVPGKGVALIAVDGRAAQPYAVGAELAPGYVVHSLARDQAMIANNRQSPVKAVLTIANVKPDVGSNVAALDSRTLVSPAMSDARPAAAAAAPPRPAGPAARQDARYQVAAIRRH